MLIDRFMPVYNFSEVHSAVVHAAPSRTFRALKEVRPSEIPLFGALFWIRSLPSRLTRRGGQGFLGTQPLLEQMLVGGFVLLAEETSRDLVLGTIGQFWRLRGGLSPQIADAEEFLTFDRADYAKATLSFHVGEDRGEGCVEVTTETRIYIPDPVTRRKFAVYWRLVHPGSAFLRRMWLRAVKRWAEQER